MELEKTECIKNLKLLIKDECDLKKFESDLINNSVKDYYNIITSYHFFNNTVSNRDEMIKVLFTNNCKAIYKKVLNDVYVRTYLKHLENSNFNLIDYITLKYEKFKTKRNKALLKSLNRIYNPTNITQEEVENIIED